MSPMAIANTVTAATLDGGMYRPIKAYYTSNNTCTEPISVSMYSKYADNSTCGIIGNYIKTVNDYRIYNPFASNNDCTTATTWGDLIEICTEEDLIPVTPSIRMREILAARSAPLFMAQNPHRRVIDIEITPAEARARQTLRRLLGEDKWRLFCRNGFTSVRAKSGKVYLLYPGHKFTQVYEGGKKLNSLCVVMQGDFPPTDSLIMRYLMILNDEDSFVAMANKHTVPQDLPNIKKLDLRPLSMIFKEIKSQVKLVA